MSIKDILVYADAEKSVTSRFKLAIGLAEVHGAHLTALRPGEVRPEVVIRENIVQQLVDRARPRMLGHQTLPAGAFRAGRIPCERLRPAGAME